ncbi:MAG TPA: hypothetical protein VGO57_02410 [Verrucomicrobiae bacterium]|jgi:hypothetical protein
MNKMKISAANHFLNLARRGKLAGASRGESAAAKAAKTLFEILPYLNDLDNDAIQGFCDLVLAINSGGYESVNDILRGVIGGQK